MAVQMKEAVSEELETIIMPAIELPTEDGKPLGSSWHRAEINLLIETLKWHWRGRQDF